MDESDLQRDEVAIIKVYIYIYIIHLLDRTETNIIIIWSGKVMLGEAEFYLIQTKRPLTR